MIIFLKINIDTFTDNYCKLIVVKMDEQKSENNDSNSSPYNITSSSSSDDPKQRRTHYCKFLYKDYDLSKMSDKTKKKYDQICSTSSQPLKNVEHCKINFLYNICTNM